MFYEKEFKSDYFNSWKIQSHYIKLCKKCFGYEMKNKNFNSHFDQYGYIKKESSYIDVDELEKTYSDKIQDFSLHYNKIKEISENMFHPDVMMARYPHIHMAYNAYCNIKSHDTFESDSELKNYKEQMYFNTLFPSNSKELILNYINKIFPRTYKRKWSFKNISNKNMSVEDIKNSQGLQYIYNKADEVLRTYGYENISDEPSKSTKKIVFFTGSGISQESGIPTFRDTDGLWNEYPLQFVATNSGWNNDPTFVNDFYNELRLKYLNIDSSGNIGIKPNSAHKDIIKLSLPYDKDDPNSYTNTKNEIVIITQNVDDLHEQALMEIDGYKPDIDKPTTPSKPSTGDKTCVCNCGCSDEKTNGDLTIPDDYQMNEYKSPNTHVKIIHLHGELNKMCVDQYQNLKEYQIKFPYKGKYTLPSNTCVKDIFPKSRGVMGTDSSDIYEKIKNRRMRPYIVFFNEDVPNMSNAINEVMSCDMFVIIGTSLNVYPAANLIDYVPNDVPIVYIDTNPATYVREMKIIQGTACEGMKELLKNWEKYFK